MPDVVPVMRDACWSTIAAAAIVFTASPAVADEVAGTRSDKLVEARHRVDITVGRAQAELRVRRTLHNGGPRHDQAEIWIDVPDAAVATGLRTLGERNGKPRWFAGDLLEADTAADRYRELTGIGGYYPKDPALLSWRDQGKLALQVFPVAPGSDKTVEYTFTLPLHYHNGEYAFVLPELGTTERAAEVTVRPAHRLDQILIDGTPVGRGAAFRADGSRSIQLRRRDPPRLDARLAVLGTGKQYVVQYQLALARRVSSIPNNASIVVVLDRSRSLTAVEANDGVTAARAYLRHFKRRGARAEVVTFNRVARRRHGSMRSVETVLADLGHFEADELANGSAVDRALSQAGSILAREPKGRPRRVVLITDTLTRSGITAKRLEVLARRTGAIVHVGHFGGGHEPRVIRDDSHAWAEVARTTGGLLWEFSVSAEPEAADDMRAAYLEWARPVRLDEVEVRSDGTFGADLDLEDSLPEGFGAELLTVRGLPVESVVVTGELWSRPVREVTTPDKAHGALWAALFFGSDALDELDEEEMMVLATRGHAVSPVTSYLAVEPGVRPSTEGLEHIVAIGRGGGGASVGTIGLGSGGGFGQGGGASPKPIDLLKTKTREAATACGVPEHTKVEVDLETTFAEIAHVARVSVPNDAVGRQCVEQAMWQLQLSEIFVGAHATWRVSV